MSISTDLLPQILVNLAALVGLLVCLPRALRRRRNRVVVTGILLVFGAALLANLRGYALQGILQGFSRERV